MVQIMIREPRNALTIVLSAQNHVLLATWINNYEISGNACVFNLKFGQPESIGQSFRLLQITKLENLIINNMILAN